MTANARQGRLTIRPKNQADKTIKSGRHSLSFEDKREALLFVPAKYKSETPAPFALMLHGAGGNAELGIGLLEPLADEFGIVLLAAKSFYPTWDAIADEYGADVEFINRALAQTFELCNIDRNRLVVGGFSDGASYALSLGLINGDLFSHIIAFSPGFMAPTMQTGAPRIFISHGTNDRVLPIERCSRRLAPQLERAGYEMIYREFNGGHTIPPDIARQSVEWFA